jgi:hypothetical protein
MAFRLLDRSSIILLQQTDATGSNLITPGQDRNSSQLGQRDRDLFGQDQLGVGGQVECVAFGPPRPERMSSLLWCAGASTRSWATPRAKASQGDVLTVTADTPQPAHGTYDGFADNAIDGRPAALADPLPDGRLDHGPYAHGRPPRLFPVL